jgi:hypothetical protein
MSITILSPGAWFEHPVTYFSAAMIFLGGLLLVLKRSYNRDKRAGKVKH